MELVKPEKHEMIKPTSQNDIFKNKLAELLNTPMSAEMKQEYLDNGVQVKGDLLLDAMSASVVVQALQGNLNAYTTIRDTMGHKPVEKVEQDTVVRIVMPNSAKSLGE